MPDLPTDLTRRAVLKGSLALPLAARAGGGGGAAPAPAVNGAARGTAGKPHVAVVGAGAFGGWTALHLRRRGARVTLLDGWGPGNSRASSGGETRVIRGLYGPDRVYVDWVVRAFALWREHERLAGQRLYHPTGALWLFRGDDGYARISAPLVREAGMAVEKLDLAEAARRWPQVRFAGVAHAWLEREAGYLLARRACATVVERFVAEGGEYRELAVRPGALGGGGLGPLVLSDGSTLAADAYVFAAGPWLAKLFPDLAGARVRPTRQEVYFFGTPAGDPRFSEERTPIWIDFGERVFYGIPGNERRGFKVADDTRGEPFDPDRGERMPSPEALARARALLAERFPDLAGAPLVESRVCQYENSPDGHFLLGPHPAAANAWLAGGGSGHGYKLGPAVGEHVAALVLGEARAIPLFRPDRTFADDATESQLKSGEEKKP
ncbi:MAG TPA: FAD-dependent oxidoreductase [Thermoanaerobaculia bacterium]|nr:FAD-dependent oxidoreductase [Thermoanaerobaculia bacterium]